LGGRTSADRLKKVEGKLPTGEGGWRATVRSKKKKKQKGKKGAQLLRGREIKICQKRRGQRDGATKEDAKRKLPEVRENAGAFFRRVVEEIKSWGVF